MKAYLQRMGSSSQRIWYYSIQIQRDLLGCWQVIREWGRSGSPGTLRQTPYTTLTEAVSAFGGLKEQLLAEGYQVVMTEGMRSWMVPYLEQESELVKKSNP